MHTCTCIDIIYKTIITVGNCTVELSFRDAMISLYQFNDRFGVLFRLLSVKLTLTNPNRSLSKQNLYMIIFFS